MHQIGRAGAGSGARQVRVNDHAAAEEVADFTLTAVVVAASFERLGRNEVGRRVGGQVQQFRLEVGRNDPSQIGRAVRHRCDAEFRHDRSE